MWQMPLSNSSLFSQDLKEKNNSNEETNATASDQVKAGSCVCI